MNTVSKISPDEFNTYTLASGQKVRVEVYDHPGGYSIVHSLEGSDSVYVTCCCEDKGCVSTECPSSSFTCDCTGTDPSISCG